MVEYTIDAKLDVLFKALSHPTRRAIVRQLSDGTATVLQIADQFNISLNGVSKHIKMLETAGLIRRDVQGRIHYCSLVPESLQIVDDWIIYYRAYWQRRLDKLDEVLQTQNNIDQTSPS